MDFPIPLRVMFPILLALLAFPVYIAAIIWVLSKVSGWSLLTRRFRETELFRGITWRWQSARFRRWCDYNNCLIVGASEQGLHLEVTAIFFPFHLCHPALFIPWDEIQVETGKAFFGFCETTKLTLGSEEQLSMRVYGKLVDRIRIAAGQRWPLYQQEQLELQTRR